MAARVLRCANLVKVGGTIIRTAQRKNTLQALSSNVQKVQGIRGTLLVNNNIMKNSLKNFSITAAAQQMVTDPLNMIQNVDIRSPSSSSSSSLSEAGAEDEDDQNCISAIFNPDVISKVEKEATEGMKKGNVFAVVHIGGRQFKVTVNDTITIFKIPAELGERIRLEKVLLVGGENFSLIGRPLLNKELVTVEATVIEKTKTAKVIVFKKKRRKGYKRTQGHRQDITVLRINSININPSNLSAAV